jgi:hypothetical protein
MLIRRRNIEKKPKDPMGWLYEARFKIEPSREA